MCVCIVDMLRSFDRLQESSLIDTSVVLKVQHPSRVGGTHDHPSWNRYSYRHSYNTNDITSYCNFNKYVLQGDNALYYTDNN